MVIARIFEQGSDRKDDPLTHWNQHEVFSAFRVMRGCSPLLLLRLEPRAGNLPGLSLPARLGKSPYQGVDLSVGIVEVRRDPQPVAARRRDDVLLLEIGVKPHRIEASSMSNADDLRLLSGSTRAYYLIVATSQLLT
jgi:hypothetical protein